MEDSNQRESQCGCHSLEMLPCELQEMVLSYLPHPDVFNVIQCSHNMYDIGRDLYRNKFFDKEYHVMKLKKKQGIRQLKEEYIRNRFNFIKEYGDVRTRVVKTVKASIKLDPIEGKKCLEEAKAIQIDSLHRKGAFSTHCGGFANAVQCFDGTAYLTKEHALDFGFHEVMNESINYIPEGTCVIQIDCGSTDIVYISPEDKKESYGYAYTIKRTEENELSAPILIDIPEKVKWVCASVSHQFAATIDDRVYCWLPHADCKPFEIKGLFNDDNEYDEDGVVIKEDTKTSEKEDEELSIQQQLAKSTHEEKKRQLQEQEKLDRKEKIVHKIVCGNHFLLVLYKSGELFNVSINENSDSHLIARRVQELEGKNIMDIEASFTHWIAFEKTEIKPITEWDNMQTSEWFKRIGFDQCGNLAKYHNIEGKTVYNADEDYMEDVLGILDPVDQQKLRYEINQVRETKYKDINLYGYGANYYGQLGLFDKHASIPKKIPLPPLSYKDDYILRFACGRRNTAILTKKGELWICGHCRHDLKKKVNKEKVNKEMDKDDNSSSDEEKKTVKKTKKEILKAAGKGKKAGKKMHGHKNVKFGSEQFEDYLEELEEDNSRKKNFRKTRHSKHKHNRKTQYMREEKKKVYDKEMSLDHRFVNFTDVFTKNEKNIPYKICNVSLGIMDFAVVMAYRNEKIEKVATKGDKLKEKKKLCTIDKILTQLQKTRKFDIDDFTINYIDRFSGIVEVQLRKFLKSSDIPLHRIQTLKKDMEVYWDKKDRIDLFQFN